jgi:plasmid stabilization system protein ParE
VKYKVIWSYFAEMQLDAIFEYYSKQASIAVASNIICNIILKSERLSTSPYLGAIEELLSDRKTPYRFTLYKNYKIIYSVDEENKLIKIADIFDVRQNPIKLKRNK